MATPKQRVGTARQAFTGAGLRIPAVVVLSLSLFLLALAPRVLATGAFVTTDEVNHWQERSRAFLQALQQGDAGATNQTGHPGVTTMWLGAAGTLAYETLVARGEATTLEPAFAQVAAGDYGRAAQLFQTLQDDYVLYLALTRLPLALVNAMWVVLCCLLLRRLFTPHVALLAGLLLATSPFLIAHSRVLHVDSLLTVYMSLSLLCLLVALADLPTTQRIWWGLFVASGVCGGLAFLTKSPSALLIPLTGLTVLVALVRAAPHPTHQLPSLIGRWLGLCLVWGSAAALTVYLLWPALWVDFGDTVGSVIDEVVGNGTQPHPNGNFFRGAIVNDPGLLFYPAALVLRLTPWALVGLLALLVPLSRTAQPDTRDGLVDRRTAFAVSMLLVFVLLFLVMMTLPAKKFDRYLLPILPALQILAAVGLMRLWYWVRSRWSLLQALPNWAPLPLVGLLAGATLFWYHPYTLAYYNPLLGGGPAAERTLTVGWGEGLEQAGSYITRQPNGCDHPVGAWYPRVILPYVCTAVMHPSRARTPGSMDYLTFYVNQIQRGIDTDMLAFAQEHGTLVHTVTLHGINYAQVYQLPRPNEHVVEIDFGDRVRLVGYDLDSTALQDEGILRLTTQWQALQPGDTAYLLFIHVLDADGQKIAQIDVPPAGPDALPQSWRTGHYYTWWHPVPLPLDTAEQAAWLAIGLYQPEDFARLPVSVANPANAPDYGADTLILTPLEQAASE